MVTAVHVFCHGCHFLTVWCNFLVFWKYTFNTIAVYVCDTCVFVFCKSYKLSLIIYWTPLVKKMIQWYFYLQVPNTLLTVLIMGFAKLPRLICCLEAEIHFKGNACCIIRNHWVSEICYKQAFLLHLKFPFKLQILNENVIPNTYEKILKLISMIVNN